MIASTSQRSVFITYIVLHITGFLVFIIHVCITIVVLQTSKQFYVPRGPAMRPNKMKVNVAANSNRTSLQHESGCQTDHAIRF